MKKLLMLVLASFISGCSSKEQPKVKECIAKASCHQEYMRWRVEKWMNKDTPKIFRDVVDVKMLEDLVHSYITNISQRYECAIPLYMIFTHNMSLKPNECTKDIRGNPDSVFEYEAVVFGKQESILCNRLYFVFPQADNVILWSRRMDGIYAKYSSRPHLDFLYNTEMGLSYIRKRSLAHVFLGNHDYCIGDFIEKLMNKKAYLYWECGTWKGFTEGMHILGKDTFREWDTKKSRKLKRIIRMKVVFHSRNTTILSVSEEHDCEFHK